jgi:L-ascorbate metabolism protein UlaG (beta-lactamase superfamily)
MMSSANVQIQLLRNAALYISLGSVRVLVDPMLGAIGSMSPPPSFVSGIRLWESDPRPWPMVGLPINDLQLRESIESLDAVFVTHTHADHWDSTARELLPKDIPLFCQPQDEALFREQGFKLARAIETNLRFRDIEIQRTSGKHGTGEIGEIMGTVSGFVLQAEDLPSVYIAGDTIFCSEVEEVLRTHSPDITVVNAGSAQFLTGAPITMTAADVCSVCQIPSTQVVAVHMEALPHCRLTRAELQAVVEKRGLGDRVSIPRDGETLISWRDQKNLN